MKRKLIDKISIIIAPVLIGGKETSSLIDGKSFHSTDDLEICKGTETD